MSPLRRLRRRLHPFVQRHPLLRRLRGIRGRLTVAYVLAACVALAAAGVLFSLGLHKGLYASADPALQARAQAVVAALRTGATALPSGATGGTEGITVVRHPGGVQLDPPGSAAARELADHPPLPDGYATLQLVDEQRFRVLTVRTALADGTWIVTVGSSLAPADSAADVVNRALFILGPGVLVVVGVGVWLLSGAALRPVERMRVDAAALGAGDSGRLTEPDTDDQLAALAATFNELLDRLQGSAEQQRRWVADAGHELRTPLAVLTTELELAARPGRSADELREAVAHAGAEVHRLSVLADNLLFLAAEGAGEEAPVREPAEEVEVGTLLEASVRAHAAEAALRGAQLRVLHEEPVTAAVQPAALRRAVDNLVSNALCAVDGTGGSVELSARRVGDAVQIAVVDDGPGFPDEFVGRAFERFSRAEASRYRAAGGRFAGAGLGLAIVASVAAAHGGSVRAETADGGGARVVLSLPG